MRRGGPVLGEGSLPVLDQGKDGKGPYTGWNLLSSKISIIVKIYHDTRETERKNYTFILCSFDRLGVFSLLLSF